MQPLPFVAAAVGGLFIAGIVRLFGNRLPIAQRVVYIASIAALLVVAAAALAFLLSPPVEADSTFVLPIGLPVSPSGLQLEMHFRLDALSAYFLLILGIVGPAVGLFAI